MRLSWALPPPSKLLVIGFRRFGFRAPVGGCRWVNNRLLRPRVQQPVVGLVSSSCVLSCWFVTN